MQDTPNMTNPDISLGGVGIGISLGLWPRDIPMPTPSREISYGFVTLGKSCYNIYSLKKTRNTIGWLIISQSVILIPAVNKVNSGFGPSAIYQISHIFGAE